jgi:pyruvate/2-oxoglutarate dehydrogenase complex dihydrolipoamide acyltransferase (E2) component
MTISVQLPKLSQTMEEGVIVEWLVGPGDVVTKGQALLQLETDKAVLEVESPAAGTVQAIQRAAGETVKVGEVIALLEGV